MTRAAGGRVHPAAGGRVHPSIFSPSISPPLPCPHSDRPLTLAYHSSLLKHLHRDHALATTKLPRAWYGMCVLHACRHTDTDADADADADTDTDTDADTDTDTQTHQ